MANIFLECEIKGEAVVDGYKDQIECSSWSWGVSHMASMGTAGGGTEGTTHVNDLTITKAVDFSSANLFAYCMKGKHVAEMKLHITKSTGDGVKDWYTITMTDCVIANVSETMSSDQAGKESVSIMFAKVQMQQFKQAKDGTLTAGADITYNVAAKKIE